MQVMDSAERERWIATMPVLARICTTPPANGKLVRSTEWGDLYLEGEHYTLVSRRKRKKTRKLPRS